MSNENQLGYNTVTSTAPRGRGPSPYCTELRSGLWPDWVAGGYEFIIVYICMNVIGYNSIYWRLYQNVWRLVTTREYCNVMRRSKPPPALAGIKGMAVAAKRTNQGFVKPRIRVAHTQ